MGRKDGKITDKLRKVLVCILMVAGLGIVVYILMPMGDMNLTGIIETSNGEKYGKRVSFLVDYVKSTGNLEIATGIGITEEDLNNFMGGDSTMLDGIFVKDTVAGIGLGEGSPSEVLESYRDSNPSKKELYGDTKWGKVESQGKTYVFEKQNAGQPQYEGSIPGTTTSRIKNSGCFLFAVAAAATNMTGKLTTVQDLIDQADAKTLVGDKKEADRLLRAWSAANPDVTPLMISTGETTASGKKYDPDMMSGMQQHVQDGKMVIIYANECDKQTGGCGSSTHESQFAVAKDDRLLSSSGHHWSLVVGIEGTNYIILCNGESARKTRVNIDYVHKHITGYYVVEEQ